MTSPVRVLVDARGTQEGFKQHRQRGIGHYAQNLLDQFPRVAPFGGLSYLLESDKGIEPSLTSSGIEIVHLKGPLSRSKLVRFLEDQITIPRAIQQGTFDVAHFLFHQDAPLRAPIPLILTVHDTIPYSLPEIYGWKHRIINRVVKQIDSIRIKMATAIIAISECTRHDVIRHLGGRPEQVRVIYQGVQDRFSRSFSSHELEDVRKKHGLPERFILYVGGIDPRKNVGTLIGALSLLCRDPEYRIFLVVVGKLSNQREYPALLARIKELGLQSHVTLPGYVPDEDLPALYAAAKAFVFPSLYEGFGLPVVQAMAAGCPVVTSRSSSIPEVAGDAAIYVDARSPVEIARGVRLVLDDPSVGLRCTNQGKAQARHFSWERTARETYAVYVEFAERFKERKAKRCTRA